jgi:hypothetical protein
MNRIEIISKIKELGLETERPAHQCKTSYLEELLNANFSVTVEVVKRGRPADPNSAAYKRKKDLEARRAAGELKRGRPIESTSERQIRLSLQGTLPLGRKPNPESAAYKRKADLEARRAAGTLKRGRPALPKAE